MKSWIKRFFLTGLLATCLMELCDDINMGLITLCNCRGICPTSRRE
jgi:hypothetical protein